MATKKPAVKYVAVATSPYGYDSYASVPSLDPKHAADEALEVYVDATGNEKEEATLVVYHVVAHSVYDVERPVEAKLTLRKTTTY